MARHLSWLCRKGDAGGFFFSLIIPALDVAEIRYGDGAIPALIVCVAILLGMGAVAIMNEVIPHEHFSSGREGPEAASGVTT